MSKQQARRLHRKWSALSTKIKAAVIVAASVVMGAGISLPVYLNHQSQQAQILAERQEQERLAAEQAEAERIAVEEQAQLDQEAQAEANRLAAKEEAARLEAERMEQERIAAEEEQAGLEAEARKEADRIAVEEAATAELARQQAEAASQQPNSNTQSKPSMESDPASQPSSCLEDSGSQGKMEEPTSGNGRDEADRMGGVWVPEWEGWVYIDLTGNYIYIYSFGGSKVLEGEDIAIAKRYLG